MPLSPPALPTSLLLDVGLDVEVGEETYEGEGVANQGVVHPLGEVTVDVERVDSVDYRKTELKLGRYEKCVCVCVCRYVHMDYYMVHVLMCVGIHVNIIMSVQYKIG